ncbi:hypothetical protein LOTGIDRAFT_111513 [Lottia gigantea]|uniref:Transient receptor ion channel domain-containing protein n=1 Tax=Lottia gigantea TaxID=225164 RepID=V4CIQ9_LOTGI|nr:hypothetical protein LOTGIDRAFT_111513 [Lottia gigantea]ESP02070.1 hypothetical protein LOTGIDRAFT_111513 [Lottia gigantea]
MNPNLDETESFGIIRKEVDLTNKEKQYLLAVERGDVPTTRQIVEQFKVNNFNINCIDTLGRTAILIAIENENIEMIELLLNNGIEIGDALLHAINEENVEAVEMILHYEISNKGEEVITILIQVPSTSFSADITPIILAGHRDNYEIIKLLLSLGCRITKPHDIRCNCKQCVAGNDDDSLRHSRSRINSYKALASPSLISLSSKDPILTAFELCADLRRLSKLENEFKIDYEKLSLKCQEFAVDLLEQTRGSSELHIILNHDTNSTADENYTERQRLARLKVAIKYKQKKFVSHPNCQQLLASLWYEGLPGFRRKNVVAKICIIQAIGFMFPILSLCYLLIPTCFLGQLIRKPFIKFIIHSASYITFLCKFIFIYILNYRENLLFHEKYDNNLKSKIYTRQIYATLRSNIRKNETFGIFIHILVYNEGSSMTHWVNNKAQS